MSHEHCASCVSSFCENSSECPVEQCKNGCGFSLHLCKWSEHDKYTCPEAQVKCTNAAYGCTELLPRKALKRHIQHCPASILQCKFVHSREPVKDGSRIHHQEEMALIDQKLLAGDMSLRSKCGYSEHAGLGVTIKRDAYNFMNRRHQDGSSVLVEDKKGRTCSRNDLEKTPIWLFYCNEIVRRDEFIAHWSKFHLDVQLSIESVVYRCPYRVYGCTYGQDHLVPTPLGTSLEYSKDMDCFLAQSSPALPDSSSEAESSSEQSTSQYSAKIREKEELSHYGYGDDEEGSYDVLGQLPAEMLLNIIRFLDSVSLWNLSLVNTYLRRVCLNLVYQRGIVYSRWEKVEPVVMSTSRWLELPKVWRFSKVSDHISSWLHADVPSLSAHILSCDISRTIPKPQYAENEKIELPS